MARKKSQTLTEAELPIMEVLWHKGTATVGDVMEGLSKDRPVAYNTVLTLMRILERKGYLKHIKDGRAHIFAPVVQQEEATRSEIRHLVSRFFKNSHEDLVLNILEDQGIEPEELARLRKMLVRNDVRTEDQSGVKSAVPTAGPTNERSEAK